MPKSKKTFHHRSQYVEHSLRFVNWVDSLELEKTWWGRVVSRLEEKFRLRRLALLFLFSLFLASLLFVELDLQFHAQVGEVTTTDIVAPLSFDFVDHQETEERRSMAQAQVPPVFDYDVYAYEKVSSNVTHAFRQARAKAQSSPQTLRVEFEKDLHVNPPDRLWQWLQASHFSLRIETAVIRVLDLWSKYKIVDESEGLAENQKQIILRAIEEGGEEFALSRSDLRSLGRRSSFESEAWSVLPASSNFEKRNILRLANLLLTPNVTFNAAETRLRQQRARDGVSPVVISVKKNQRLVQAGSVIQPHQIALLHEVERLRSSRHQDFVSLMVALMLMALMLVFFSYLRRFTLNRVRIESKDILVMGVVSVLVVLITKVVFFFADAAFTSKYGRVGFEESLLFLAPVASGPMLVGLLISSGEVVWMFTIFMATVLGIMVDMQFPFIIVTIVGGIAAARGVFNCKTRNAIYFAGVRTGLVNAVMIVLALLVATSPGDHLGSKLLWAAPAGFLSGILSALVAMMLIPLLETIFNYTTDVKLLELANLNHPLLKDMIVKAPGTYHHSLIVGSMVEAAAEEIGANPLLAKVMAYYHDIGKTEHAAYFIENQRPGQNPHDHLSPHMSKTILIAHVKDGVELGMRYKLGKPIIDGIWQHHGTTLISYFYNKALEREGQNNDAVSEEDFRYPGPKPQFREAALCMLADSIEAAARSLDEPTAARLQNIVKNIIQRKFMDGQLDECNLTLRNLSMIEKCFDRILLGIYRQRIDYARKAPSPSPSPSPGTDTALGNLKSLAEHRRGTSA